MITEVHIPRWSELPELELYMDQVINLLEIKLSPLMSAEEKPMTSAMINNYVKQKVITAPVRKKYDRFHLAQIFVVALLKKVLTIGETHQVLRLMGDASTMPKAYDMFCEHIEESVNRRASGSAAPELSDILEKCAAACALRLDLSSCLSGIVGNESLPE